MDYLFGVIFDFFINWPWLRANGSTRGNRFVFGCLMLFVLGLVLLVAALLWIG